ncbi:hypothetical protein C2E23DRAFT_852192 [Lenzites betulinus]|nr:hypothetical protein C2E23DRAFT_852192 [Lenzites betulinus]
MNTSLIESPAKWSARNIFPDIARTSAAYSTAAQASPVATKATSDILTHTTHLSLTVQDRCRFALYGVGLQRPVEPSCIHHIISRYARTAPDATAASHLGDTMTYQELDRASDRLARHLALATTVSRGSRVCLLVQRSLHMLVGILGILKAGAAYIPLDGGIVTDKTLSHVLKDSGAAAVVCTSAFALRVPHGTPAVPIEAHMSISADAQTSTAVAEFKCMRTDPSSHLDEAYVIYTSGTTGMPKGVSVTHRNVTNLLCNEPGNLHIQPGTKVSQLLNIAFDMCAWEVLGCLLNGGTLVLRGSGREDWHNTLRSVDVVIATPTVLQRHRAVDYPNVRIVATAGEPCPRPLADEWSAEGRTFYNCCGPTETTIVNTMHRVGRGTRLSIGSPTPNNRVYILGGDLQPLPIGCVGTMWAAGYGVTAGYVNRPELTHQKYMQDPFCDDGMMFNTGDLGRWNEYGELEHFGRADDQVKVKGFRVELDGVASVMEAHPAVQKAVAILVGAELCGFVSPSSAFVPDVRTFIEERLPYYSVPSTLVSLDEFPMTANGKVDKKALQRLVSWESMLTQAKGDTKTDYGTMTCRIF